MRKIQKILIDPKTGKKFYVKDVTEDFHSSLGVVKKEDLASKKLEVATVQGNTLLSIVPQFADLWEDLRRGPQIMQQKEIGMILAKTGLNRSSVVVDAGGGSGSLCLSLANVCKKVIVYEINPEHYDLVQKNAQLFGIQNIVLKQEDIYQGISEKNVDLITLDLPEPWHAIPHAEKSLRSGGHLVVYLPNLNQMKEFIDSTRSTKIKVIETLELLERKWVISEKQLRPEFQMLGHTGFLTFCRRL